MDGEELRTYYFGNYTPAADIITIAICLVIFILMHTAYITKNKRFTIFRLLVVAIVLAAACSVCFHYLLERMDLVSETAILLFRFGFHCFLYIDLFLYILYTREQMHLTEGPVRFIFHGIGLMTIGLIVAEYWMTFQEKFFLVLGSGQAFEKFNLFPFGYVSYAFIIVFLLITFRKRVIRQVIVAVIGSSAIAFLLLYLQESYRSTSFTASTFLFPALTLFYMMHSNPYNLEIGAVDVTAFESMIQYCQKKKKEMILMSLLLVDQDVDGKQYSEKIKSLIRKFAADFYKGATLFQISNGRTVLAASVAKNPDYENTINSMLNRFQEEYPKYKLPFKIVIIKNWEMPPEEKDYVGLIKYMESEMKVNEVQFMTAGDAEGFEKQKYIVSELHDICKKKDLNDERIKVYCQPIWNLQMASYDTAEALMRLELPELGMVYPNTFIPLAEKHQFIHQMSLIILNKTCRQIREMLDDGYSIMRISVNISALELRDDEFCNDVNHVIRDSGIPYDKIAIELTESQNEGDFMIMKDKIEELRHSGIKFYLDDFGTGYSNFERIMELPFDIIKFDRSLVLASAADTNSEKMVLHLARMFNDMDYSILYEGVENLDDENRCINMDAKFLQGYKYSKPIPLSDLRFYLQKKSRGGEQ